MISCQCSGSQRRPQFSERSSFAENCVALVTCFWTLVTGIWPLIFCLAVLFASTAASATERVRIETGLGDIEVLIETEKAPATAANFLRYLDEGHYDGGQFHRTVTMDNQPNNEVKIEVIQGSVNLEKRQRGFGPIAIERTTETGLAHRDGVISMARGGPDSATSSFFFCIGDQPELDFGGKRNPDGQGFAAFGKIIAGDDVVRKIQSASHEGQRLSPVVPILRAYRLP